MSTQSRPLLRLPRVLRNIGDLALVVGRLRFYASAIEDTDRKERQQLKDLEEKKQKIREKTAKKRERYKSRIRSLTPRALAFAQDRKRDLLSKRSRTVATLPSGNALQWGSGLLIELPEDLDEFFEEMAEREREDVYVRTRKEPNKIALRLKENAKEVGSFRTVKRVEGPRVSFNFPGVRRRVDAYLEDDGALKEVVVTELRE